MKKLQDYKFWFIVGSQFLYGPEALKAVEDDARKMVDGLNASGKLPAKIEFKAVGTTAEVIDRFVMDANYDDTCAGIITWMPHILPVQNVDTRSFQTAETVSASAHSVQSGNSERSKHAI